VLEFELRRLPAAGPSWPAALQLGLNMALALTAFWLLRWAGIRWGLAAGSVVLLTALLGGGIALGVLRPGLEATRSALPTAGLLAVAWGSALAYWTVDRLALMRLSEPVRRLMRDLLAMGCWSLVLYSGVRLLQVVYGPSGVWPLKAGVWPHFTPLVAFPAMVFTGWLALVVWLLWRVSTLPDTAPARRYGGFAALLLVAGAVLLPVALKVSVRGWESLYYTFGENLSDYIHDVPRVGNDPLGFLARYVELSPTLTLHSSTHPPGSVLLLWGVAQVLGEGAVPATWVAIVLSSMAPLAACWLGMRLGGLPAGLLAGALTVVMPGHTVYSVTSMDGIFNGLLALGMVAFFLALEPNARLRMALLAGGLIALALFFTYAATQLFFFGVAVAALALLRGHTLAFVLRQGTGAAGVIIIAYTLLYLATGFDVVAGAIQATENNAVLIGKTVAGDGVGLFVAPALDQHLFYILVNSLPFLWYLAPWGLAALAPPTGTALRTVQQGRAASLTSWHVLVLGVLALVGGMLAAGLFNREVERIWAFVYPLAAVVMVQHIWQGDTLPVRLWRGGLWLTLFFAQSAVMRMLLNTYW
jgi:hypothetical protein